jgi:hypothetical protein
MASDFSVAYKMRFYLANRAAGLESCQSGLLLVGGRVALGLLQFGGLFLGLGLGLNLLVTTSHGTTGKKYFVKKFKGEGLFTRNTNLLYCINLPYGTRIAYPKRVVLDSKK